MDPASDVTEAAWLAESPAPVPCPPLAGDRTVDVAVIGGGVTGVSTAWHLRERFPELGIALLEARVLGHGASGRNGGQVLNGINGVHGDDPGLLRRVHAATSQGIDVAEALAARLAPGTFRRRGCLEVLTSAARAEAAHARVERLAALGLPLRFLPGVTLGLAGVHGAVLDPLAGRLNAFALLQAMRGALRNRDVAVHEGTRVVRLREGSTITLETPHGTVRARAVVLATNAWTPQLGWFRHGILPLHSHVLATAPLDDAAWTRLGWDGFDGFSDDRDRIAYALRTPGGRLLFGGGGNAAYAYRFGGSPEFPVPVPARHVAFLRRTMTRYVPAVADVPVRHVWTGPLAITLDRVCTMGVGGAHRNVYWALGYSGHGLALGLLAGVVLTDLYAGDDARWRDLPFHQRRLLPLPPEPLRWLGYQLYTRLTGRSPRRTA